MMPDPIDGRDGGRFVAPPADGATPRGERLPCPNCCRLAYVTRRALGLVFYRCDLCETVGAAPDGAAPPGDTGSPGR